MIVLLPTMGVRKALLRILPDRSAPSASLLRMSVPPALSILLSRPGPHGTVYAAMIPWIMRPTQITNSSESRRRVSRVGIPIGAILVMDLLHT